MKCRDSGKWSPVLAVCAVVLLCVTGQARAQNLINFSVDAAVGLPGTAVNPSGDLADIYSSIQDGSNAMGIPKALLGLQAGDNVNALSIWYAPDEIDIEAPDAWWYCWLFSVDPAAGGVKGTPPDVYSEAQLNEAAGDVFWTIPRVNVGRNKRSIDEASIGLLGPGTPSEDDLDALDLPQFIEPPPGVSVYFSLTPGSPSLGNPPGYQPGDVLMSPLDSTFSQAYDHTLLGLQATDDLDALYVALSTFPFFSVAPGGPSGLGPGDILVPDGWGMGPGGDGVADVLIPAPWLGLQATDNLNALDASEGLAGDEVAPCEGTVVPSADPGLPVHIDGGPAVSTLDVGSSITIADINVTIDIDHTYDQDLVVELQSPEATTVELFSNVDLAGNDFDNATLSDEAGVPIVAGAAPFAGAYSPEELLAAFDGEDAQGTWTLTITDSFPASDEGDLQAWGICINQPGEEGAPEEEERGIKFSVHDAPAGATIGMPATAVNANAVGDPPSLEADIYEGFTGINVIVIPKPWLGLLPNDDLDALSIPDELTPPFAEDLALNPDFFATVAWHFSVDPSANGVQGAPQDVFSQAAVNEAAGDVFMSQMPPVIPPPPGTNSLAIDDWWLGLDDNTAPAPEDDQDALDLWEPEELLDPLNLILPLNAVYFSLAAGSPSLTPGIDEGDILASDGLGGFYMVWDDGLLGILGEDLDALFVSAGFPYFSVAASGGPFGPGDIYVPDGTLGPVDGAAEMLVPAAALGLQATDELNSLDVTFEPFVSEDTDEDGLPDWWEDENDLDPGDPGDADDDPDEDGLDNQAEYDNETDPQDDDTDNDGMPDGFEVDNDFDPNNDDEMGDDGSEEPDGTPDGQNDFDGDGYTNEEEYDAGSDPRDPRWTPEAHYVPLTGAFTAAILALAIGVLGYRKRRA